MSAAHTPGPWQWNDDGLNPVTVYGPTDVDANDRPTAQTICELSDSPEDCGVANARLIAAAPDLLEALRRIADMRDRDGNAIEMRRDELRGVARAAIAKATGEA